MTTFLITLAITLAICAVIGIWITGFLDSVMDGYFETSPLSDPRAGGSGDGAPPASDPPTGAGGVFPPDSTKK